MATFGELRTIVREEFLDDHVEPYRHSDAMLLRLLRDAEVEACRRGSCELIFDETMTLNLVAGRQSYPLDPLILKLPRVIWTGSEGNRLLEKVSECSLDDWLSKTWRVQDAGEPTSYFIHGRTLYLDRAPTDEAVALDATLNLQAWRLPLEDNPSESDEPEINVIYHQSLCHWAAYRALSRPDEDDMRKQLAEMNLALFTQAFGLPVDASTLEYQLASTGALHHSTGNAYRDTWRKAASDWIAELG